MCPSKHSLIFWFLLSWSAAYAFLVCFLWWGWHIRTAIFNANEEVCGMDPPPTTALLAMARTTP